MEGTYAKEIVTIIDTIKHMSSGYSPREIFSDWVKCTSIAISNASTLFPDTDKEKEYTNILTKYNKKDRENFPKMLGCLVEIFEKDEIDALGTIFMSGEFKNKRGGQFFTPFHISYLTAQTALKQMEEKGECQIYEPACGSGGMIIAAAKALKEAGYDYQHKMRVIAQDIDWNSVYMTHVQLSLLGIEAIIVQGDSLREDIKIHEIEKRRKLFTPRRGGVLI